MADYKLVEANKLTNKNDAPPPSSDAILETLPRSDQSEGGGVVSSGSPPNGKAMIEAQQQAGVNQQRSPASVTEAHIQHQLQKSVCTTTSLVICPYSDAQPISCVPNPTLPEQRPSPPKAVNVSSTEVDQQNPCGVKTKIAAPALKVPVSDGFNWRKYGQKQVKSPIGSRSYYRCTHSDCSAKKVEFCDHSGHVIEVVSKGDHSHDPPLRANSTRESRRSSSAASVVENKAMEHPIRMLNHQVISPYSNENTREILQTDKKQQKSGGASVDGNENNTKEEDSNEPELKRAKKSNVGCSGSLLKPAKKSKLVVHAAGDVGISGDGYRWRKYGQKMVKGNPHPRNYYRCTSAGCPVRKHIETAVDNTNAVIITYKGVHDHDMPVPKKRHGLPSAPLVAASAPASVNNLQLKKPDSCATQISSTQWSVDKEGELSGEALDLGGEKAMESARTLLSIGIEIKPC